MPGAARARRPRARRRRDGGRVLRHERAGGGRRRAGPDEDGRPHALRRLRTAGSAPSTSGRVDRGSSTRCRSPRAGRTSCCSTASGCSSSRRARPGRCRASGRLGIRAPWPYPSRTTVTEVDVSDPARLRVVRTLELEGGYLTARLVGRAARIVLSSPMGPDLPFVSPSATNGDTARATERNRAVVEAAGARRWLPGYTIAWQERRRDGARHARRLPQRPRARSASRVSAWSRSSRSTSSAASTRSTRTRSSPTGAPSTRRPRASTSPRSAGTRGPTGRARCRETSTAIHRFDIASPTQTHYRGSGTVAGVLLNQWSLSERDGVLRVASTEQPLWWGGPRTESETVVTTLGARGGALVQLGRVGGLGKGERVYAVRFVGDTGYVVTFRQVDPLYTLDLSRPEPAGRPRRAEDPRLLGVPPPGRRRPPARDRTGRDRRGTGARRPGLALRRLRPAPTTTARRVLAREGVVGG